MGPVGTRVVLRSINCLICKQQRGVDRTLPDIVQTNHSQASKLVLGKQQGWGLRCAVIGQARPDWCRQTNQGTCDRMGRAM